MKKFSIHNLDIIAAGSNPSAICYILYPVDLLDNWIDDAAERYGVSIAVVTHIDWDNDLTPWPAPGVPTGTQPFAGEAAQFLSILRGSVLPEVEKRLNIAPGPVRTLAGVSLAGLFTFWQWLECDLFENIISISGSFWYEGFIPWFKSRALPHKSGRAYFLLGDKEDRAPVPQFRTVQTATVEIVRTLTAAGVRTEFQLVPGNHYQYAIERLDRAFTAMFLNGTWGHPKVDG